MSDKVVEPRESVMSGARRSVPAAPLASHLARFSDSDSTALLFTDDTCTVRVSYAELSARTNALARGLAARARSVGANRDGDCVVAVCMQPTHNTVMAMLATWKAGAAYVPMEPRFPQQRINHILQDAEPALVIYDDSCKSSMFADSGVASVSFEQLALEASGLSSDALSSAEMLAISRADSVAILLYTSGSTGVPKGVRLSYSSICNRLWWQFHMFPFMDTETTCVWKTIFTFSDSVNEIWGPLLQGRSLLILPQETNKHPHKLVRVLTENKVERIVLIPSLLRFILMYLSLNRLEKPLQHLKLWVCSGETLSKELAIQFFQYFGDHRGYRLANFYGSTEVAGDVTYYVLENTVQLDLYDSIPIGSPLDNCEVYLLDHEMHPVRELETGEICVAGANVACGYAGGMAPNKFCNNPYASSTEFSRLYRTGDFGTIQQGVLMYAGRTDSQVKIRGHRVDLQEVERAVVAIDGVETAVVLCYGMATGDPVILAFVTLERTVNINAHHIETTLKDALLSYMLPQVILIDSIDSIPLLVSGKVDRQALLKMYENRNKKDCFEKPLNFDYSGVDCESMEKARILFDTVAEVLGPAARGALSVSAGFYEIGGNSLNSIHTITRLRDKGYYIEINDFLEAANLGEMLSKLSMNPNPQSVSEQTKFTTEPMTIEHKQHIIDMVGNAFCVKAGQRHLVIHQSEFEQYVSACWDALLSAGLSIVLKDDNGTPVGVALNFDARDEPEIKLTGRLAKIKSFLEYVEGPVRDTMLPKGKGTILHASLMATAKHLKAAENVAAIRMLEECNIKVARDNGFSGVFTSNTSPLTQQLCTDILGFQTLVDYQINEYVDSDGDRIFKDAPDDNRIIVCWKTVK